MNKKIKKMFLSSLLVSMIGMMVCWGCSDNVEYTYNTVNTERSGMERLTGEPRLTRLEFLADDNPELLVDDVVCTITGDSVAECWVPHVMGGKRLVARFTVSDIASSLPQEQPSPKVLADGERMESGVTVVDYARPVTLTVTSQLVGEGLQPLQHDYTVYVHAFTGLPVLWIETEDEAPIESKEEYVRASFRLTEDVVTRSPGDVVEMTGQIRGRGNSTWSLPKKPYRLKLDTKTELLGMPADKSWVLLANYSDKTMLRTATAMHMGQMSNIGFTPRAHFVELMLNGRYEGTYQLCEKLELSRHRIDVGGEGFLLEIDQRAKAEDDGPLVSVEHIKAPIVIKEPDVKAGSEDYAYVSSFLAEADSVLFSDGFRDPDRGWRKYLDMDSFVDWYVVNEIAKNNDAYFFASCYMNLLRDSTNSGGWLRMGPLWDFDLAFGNVLNSKNYEPEGFYVRFVPWYARLLRDPDFLARVKERFGYFYNHRDDILNDINENARYLNRAAAENENRWGTLYKLTWQNHEAWGNYHNEVNHLKEWIIHRMDWLRNEFEKMKP